MHDRSFQSFHHNHMAYILGFVMLFCNDQTFSLRFKIIWNLLPVAEMYSFSSTNVQESLHANVEMYIDRR